MGETQLTPKQKRWLEASKKIGPGPMTKSERETLEKLYSSMLPAEQLELKKYIEVTFGNKSEPRNLEDEPTIMMERIVWSDPSEGLKNTLSRTQKPRWLRIEPD